MDADEKQPKMVETKERVITAQPAKRRLPRTPLLVVAIVGVLALMGTSFGAGLMLGSHANAACARMSSFGSGYAQIDGATGQIGYGGGMRRGGMNRAGVTGTVSAISSSSITIQDTTSSTKTFVIDSNTRVTKSDGTAGAVSDITNGTSVSVRSVETAGKPTAWVIAIR